MQDLTLSAVLHITTSCRKTSQYLEPIWLLFSSSEFALSMLFILSAVALTKYGPVVFWRVAHRLVTGKCLQ